jgi:hypothetical protein
MRREYYLKDNIRLYLFVLWLFVRMRVFAGRALLFVVVSSWYSVLWIRKNVVTTGQMFSGLIVLLSLYPLLFLKPGLFSSLASHLLQSFNFKITIHERRQGRGVHI